jgi:hypothetical protein
VQLATEPRVRDAQAHGVDRGADRRRSADQIDLTDQLHQAEWGDDVR